MWFPRPTRVNLQFKMDPVSATLNLSRYQNLCKLHLDGFMRKAPNLDKLPRNLISLPLKHNELAENPMVTLKELPKLKILKLVNSFKGGITILVLKTSGLEILIYLETASLLLCNVHDCTND
ncbi:hypothetical protein F0562_001798 [Nyssa sinensis]|uniref:Uncharacterized protein n=1 Tax=Nyssa sinensis TaxID=561372 RepID=A0A5J5C5M3_9ASTE|nr:hypothetical protein F0562_001798 [Nyssa sinensis]